MSLITFLGLAVSALALICFYLIRLLGKKEIDHAGEIVTLNKDIDFYKYMSVEIQKNCDTISDGYKKAKTLLDVQQDTIKGIRRSAEDVKRYYHKHQKQHQNTINKLNNDITKLKRQVKRSRKDANRVIRR